MTKPKVAFDALRHLLLGMGFREVVVPESHIGFHHDDSGAEIMLPVYRADQTVAPRYLLLVRLTLDAKGFMDGDKFDDFVESRSATHSAS